MRDSKSIKISIASRLDCVCLVVLAVRGICSSLPLDREQAIDLEQAVCEAVNNAIEHAHVNDRSLPVEIEFQVQPDCICIHIFDHGLPFRPDPKAIQDPVPPRPGCPIPERGRGLYIISRTMDEWFYSNGQGRKVLTLKKFFTRPPV